MSVKVLAMVLLGAGLVGTTTMSVRAEQLDSACNAYQQVIQQNNEKVYDGFTGDDLGYGLYYIDADEIPELFVSYPNGGMDIFTMNNDQCIYVMSVYDPYKNEKYEKIGSRVFYQEGKNSLTVYSYGMESDKEWQEIGNYSILIREGNTLCENLVAQSMGDDWYIGEERYSEEQISTLFLPEDMKEIAGDWENPSTMSARLQNGVGPEINSSFEEKNETAQQPESAETEQPSEAAAIALELADLVKKDLQQEGKKENYDEIYSVYYFKWTTFDYEVTAVEGDQVTLQIRIEAPNYISKRDAYWIALFNYCYENEISSISADDKRQVFFLDCLWGEPQPENLCRTSTITITVGSDEEVLSTAVKELYETMNILPEIYNGVTATPNEEELAQYRKLGYQQYAKSNSGQEKILENNAIEIFNDMSGNMAEGYGILDSMLLAGIDAIADEAKASAESDPVANELIDQAQNLANEYVDNHSLDQHVLNKYADEIGNTFK